MFKSGFVLLFTTLFLSGNSALAQEDAIGYVKTAAGDATVVDAGKAIKAQPGTPLQIGNVLKTGKQGSMGVTFKDNTTMALGPDTEIAVDEYLYAPSNDKLKLGATMAKGSLQYVSGVIAKLKPEAIVLKTPSGTIGVRGTRFLLKVDADDK